LRQVEAAELLGKNFVTSKQCDFVQKTFVLEVVERRGVSIIVTALE
jgi:hypothetical protein